MLFIFLRIPTRWFCNEHFLNGIEFPTINKLSRDSLEKNIQIEEIKESIASMKSGKAQGLMGFQQNSIKFFLIY